LTSPERQRGETLTGARGWYGSLLMRLRPACLLLALVLAGRLTAAGPLAVPHPKQGAAPLLHVLFSGPEGVRVTFYQGQAPPREFATPVVVGLRPGYIYRVKVSGFPDRPGLELFPTLEVRGTIRLGPDIPGARHPCPVFLSQLDAEEVLDGSLITKVFYLEDPCKAIAELGRRDRPFEAELPPERDLLDEARNLGRPVLVVRLGNRNVSDEELHACSVPNTILFPGECDMGWPRRPPMLPFATWQWYDPIHGPKPLVEECLCDGGDRCEPVGFDGAGQLQGLDPEDTVAEYRDSAGRKKIAISNCVCVCVPRFSVLRNLLHLDQNRLALGPGAVRKMQGQVILEGLQGPQGYQGQEQVVDVIARQAPAQTEALMTTMVSARVEGARPINSILYVRDVAGVCREEPKTPECPLLLQKWSDKCDAQIGDIVTFTLKYSNDGGRPITDVIVSDSLTGRLEYVPGSAQSSRDAVFTTQPNDAGSQVLRWQITGALLPGQSGVVRFQTRVR